MIKTLKEMVESRVEAQLKNEGYQGYSNYPTWGVGLIIDNDRKIYEQVLDAVRDFKGDEKEWTAFADFLKNKFSNEIEREVSKIRNPIARQLLEIASSEVNWDELAKEYWTQY